MTPTNTRLTLIPGATASTSSPEGKRPRIPLTMPSAQVYYWSSTWQRAEKESLADYDAGKYIESSDPEEIIRWLDAPEDTEA